MASFQSFEEMDIWQSARKIANTVYDLSDSGRFSKDFGLRDQMRRASISILSNIAEGFESQSQQTFVRYLAHAKASAGESRAQLYIALDRKYLTAEEFTALKSQLLTCSRQIQSLIRYLDSQPNARRVKENGVTYDL